jgi:hypothetical protein
MVVRIDQKFNWAMGESDVCSTPTPVFRFSTVKS